MQENNKKASTKKVKQDFNVVPRKRRLSDMMRVSQLDDITQVQAKPVIDKQSSMYFQQQELAIAKELALILTTQSKSTSISYANLRWEVISPELICLLSPIFVQLKRLNDEISKESCHEQ